MLQARAIESLRKLSREGGYGAVWVECDVRLSNAPAEEAQLGGKRPVAPPLPSTSITTMSGRKRRRNNSRSLPDASQEITAQRGEHSTIGSLFLVLWYRAANEKPIYNGCLIRDKPNRYSGKPKRRTPIHTDARYP